MINAFYVTIKGAKQGTFKGESTNVKYQAKIPGTSFQFELTRLVDLATGQASGRDSSSPVTFTKERGAASPQILEACLTGESLDTLFEFVKADPTGAESVYYTIHLTGALVTGVKQRTSKVDPGSTLNDLEDVSFVFKKIEEVHSPTKTTVAWDWATNAPV